jgi:membrane fusion protein (multidrug efflux system)
LRIKVLRAPMQIQLLRTPILILALLFTGCGAKDSGKKSPSPEVGYVIMTSQSAPLNVELAGRTTAYETSDVRPQVSGVIKARRFQEGALVSAGQTLYEIDPSLYRAAVAQAQANLENAQAVREAAEAKAVRFRPLADMEAVAKQDYTDAAAAAKQAVAAVAQNKAALDTAQINLQFTRVPAPISGRIGRSLATTGALVTNGQANPLTTIQRLDPIFVDIQQSSADLVALRRSLSDGGSAPSSTAVHLVLEDGSDYPLVGQLEFAEAVVDQNTGTVTLRARFPNPSGLLLPGMFVRAKLSQATTSNAILVPQQGLSRDPHGNATVMLVGPGNKALLRTVVAARTVGGMWLVTQGLTAGDKVIIEGLNRIKPDQAVQPVPAGSPPTVSPETGGGGAATKP